MAARNPNVPTAVSPTPRRKSRTSHRGNSDGNNSQLNHGRSEVGQCECDEIGPEGGYGGAGPDQDHPKR